VKDPDPDPYLWLMDPDPGDPKTCGFGESGARLRTLLTTSCEGITGTNNCHISK